MRVERRDSGQAPTGAHDGDAMAAIARMHRPGSLHNRYFMLAALAMVGTQMMAAGIYERATMRGSVDAPLAVTAPEAETGTASEITAAPIPEVNLRLKATPQDLPAITAGNRVIIDRVFFDSVPEFTGNGNRESRRQFIAFVLPMILEANSEIEDERARITAAARRGHMAELVRFAQRYEYSPGSADIETMRRGLLERVAPVPVSIALAQAAIESGWGRSRFAREGNALFGQRTNVRELGITATGDASVFVRKFDTPLQSVRSYMRNLNVHDFYADFRARRARINMEAPSARNIRSLAESLGNYSVEREEYVEKLLAVIRTNDLRHYDRAVFAEQ